MATVEQVARASFGKILVSASEAPTEPDEYADFIFSMNNFMLDLEAKGVNLGYTPVSDLSDVVTIPGGALRGVINNMAVEVADDYGGTVTQSLAALATEGMKTLRKLGVRVGQTALPSTLPRGSGNEGGWLYRDSDHFNPNMESSILAMTKSYLSAPVAVPIAVIGTPVKVGGAWLDVMSNYFTLDRAGKATYDPQNSYTKRIDVLLLCKPDAGSNINFTATIYVNGAAIAVSAVSALASLDEPTQVRLTAERIFKESDYVEIYLQNDDDVTDFTVTEASLNIG